MRGLKLALMAAAASTVCMTTAARAETQVRINIGVAPECPYGFYDAAPVGCAPSDYYGPEWLNGEVFIGAGPSFHGPASFRGHVNNGFHPEHGYKGPMPSRGEKAERSKRVDEAHFDGSEQRDRRGHSTEHKR